MLNHSTTHRELERLRKGLVLVTSCLLFSLLLLAPLFAIAPAQSPQSDLTMGDDDLLWSFTFGANDTLDTAYSVINCEAGGYLLVGSSQTEEAIDVLIFRLNDAGDLEWSTILTQEGTEIAKEVIECESGGYAIIGYSQKQGANGTLLEYDALLIRVAANGTIVWTQTIGTNSSQQAYSVVECRTGGFAFAGYTNSSENNNLDFWLVRTTSEGQALWNRTYNMGGNEICYSLIENHIGGFVLVGSKESIDPGELDGWIINTDSIGNHHWDRIFNMPGDDVCHKIIRKSNIGYVIVGTTENAPEGNYDAFVLYVLTTGNFSWNAILGGSHEEEAFAITSCQNGGYAITGYTIEETQFGNKTHLMLTRLASNGDVQWSKRYGGMGKEIGWSIIQSPTHDFIIAGTTEPYNSSEPEMNALIIRVPDAETETNTNPFGPPDPPNYDLIAYGAISGIIIIAGMSVIYSRSKREITEAEIGFSNRQIQKTFFLPRTLNDITAFLQGIVRCRKCGTIQKRKETLCDHCNALLHRCMFCDNTINNEDLVIFCPSCKNLSHAHEMLSWLKKRKTCPICRFKLKKT